MLRRIASHLLQLGLLLLDDLIQPRLDTLDLRVFGLCVGFQGCR